MTERIVHCTDAIEWLKENEIPIDASLVASLPDISEFNLSLDEWKKWFISTAELIMQKTPDTGVCIFYQSDIKIDGVWIDKGFLIQKAAENSGMNQVWHKIVCRSPLGIATFGRPSYSHILCFSKKFVADVSKSSPDVLTEIGDKAWVRGMGLEACKFIAHFINVQVHSKTLINPFCGHGSMLATAQYFGLDAIGIEKSPKRAKKASELNVSVDGKTWLLT